MRAKNEPKSTVSEGEFSEVRSALLDILERSERVVEGAARVRTPTQRRLLRVRYLARKMTRTLLDREKRPGPTRLWPRQTRSYSLCVCLLFPLHRLQDLIGAVEGVFG